MKLKYFSTFTGIGGLDWGLEKIGAECVGFSEIKESSIKIYLSHYPDRINFGDITKIDPLKLPDFDIFTGGFPCQSFSLAGLRKGFADTRGKKGQMIFYIYNILLAKKPKFVVLENVKGLLMHDNGKTYRNVFKLLMNAGYYVRVLLLNSKNYGSPQARERIVFLCSLKEFDLKNPEKLDNTKRFRDVRDNDEKNYKQVSKGTQEKLIDGTRKGILLGGYDLVNTLTTGVASSGRAFVTTQMKDGNLRAITEIEGERCQGFPDDWTKEGGASRGDRWFAIGNAVNCKVSEYLFTNYLKGLWW